MELIRDFACVCVGVHMGLYCLHVVSFFYVRCVCNLCLICPRHCHVDAHLGLNFAFAWACVFEFGFCLVIVVARLGVIVAWALPNLLSMLLPCWPATCLAMWWSMAAALTVVV